MYRYCLECGWRAGTDGETTEEEVSQQAIEHFVETGHPVETVRPPPVIVRN